MPSAAQQGGVQALPIAAAFLATGGRLTLTPHGILEPALNVQRIFASDDARDARRSFIIGRRFIRRLRNPRFERSVKALVVQNGERSPNGWLVMEGGR